MGEYAIRKLDRKEIKIGTCESMYYLRFEDRSKVAPLPNNVDVSRDSDAAQLLFRLPFPDEDGMQPGQYSDFNRGERLYRASKFGHDDFEDAETLDDPGLMQLRHEQSGLLVNMPCYHGQRLPELTENGKKVATFWNGKGHSFELHMLRCVRDEETGNLALLPVVRCRHCGHAWRYRWETIWEFIPYNMQVALREYSGLRSATAVA